MTDEMHSKPPPRLADDPAVAPDVRDGLTELADTQLPFDTAAGLSSFQDVLASSGELASAASAASTLPTGALIGGGVALLVIGASLVTWLAPSSKAPATPSAPPPIAAPAAPAPSPAVPAAPAEPEPVIAPIEGGAPPAAQEAPLDREVAAMVKAKALVEQKPRAALAILRRLEREHPRGALSEERAGLRVLALWAAGEHEAARSERSAFLARYPQSPLRERLMQLEAP